MHLGCLQHFAFFFASVTSAFGSYVSVANGVLKPEGHDTSLAEFVFPAHMPVMSSQQFATVGLLPAVGCVGLAFAFFLLLEQVKSEQVSWSQQDDTVVPAMAALFTLSL
jgi:hypothetical protein